MDVLASHTTRVSLLAQLRRDLEDQKAWGEFVERYGTSSANKAVR